jgi:hypothetical protein
MSKACSDGGSASWSNAAGALPVVVTRSCASLGESAHLLWEQGGYVLRSDAHGCRRGDVRRLVEEARLALPARAASLLRDALALWRDDALADVRFAPLATVHAALAQEHPLRERVWAHWMLALYRTGRQAKALRVYAQLRATLAEEVGLDRSPELRDLERAILEQRADLSQWTTPEQHR